MSSPEERHKKAIEKEDPQYQFAIHLFTCNRCPDESTCKHAWDPYNLDHDCLMDK
ncbi:MAG: hypothetical protein ACTSW1_07560 [Candidatus Hodarchaeales archaeon]